MNKKRDAMTPKKSARVRKPKQWRVWVTFTDEDEVVVEADSKDEAIEKAIEALGSPNVIGILCEKETP